LAFSYRNSGKLKKSLEVTQQIISDPKRSKREVAFAAYAHAKVQAMLYQLDRATENVNLALPVYLNRYGKDSAQVADSHALLFSLKVIKNSSGNLTMMQKEQSNLVEQFNQAYSENHSSIAQLYEVFAQAYFLTNDLTSAISQQKKALAIFHLNTDVTVTDISHSYLRLAKYQILSGDAQNAINSIAIIDHSNFDSLPNHLLAEYYLVRTSGLIATENVTSAKQALSLANQYLIDSEFKDLLAEYHFRIAQIAALESNWRLCSENAEKATQIAENLYPKTWVLSDIYRYLADKCLQQTSTTNPENLFPYMDKLKISPWAQEIKITTQIKLLK
jgi:tetratricopeptide (TPR) repeat protein